MFRVGKWCKSFDVSVEEVVSYQSLFPLSVSSSRCNRNSIKTSLIIHPPSKRVSPLTFRLDWSKNDYAVQTGVPCVAQLFHVGGKTSNLSLMGATSKSSSGY
jgi:hypothetical protein